MPSYKVGATGEGTVSALLDVVQRKRARQEQEEDEFRKFRFETQKAILGRDDVSDEFVSAMLSGQPTAGIAPLRPSTPFDAADLQPGQTYSRKVPGGTLTSQGPPRPEDEAKAKRSRYAQSSALRKELLGNQITKDYQLVETQVRSLDSLAKAAKANPRQNMAGLQQAAITIFGKVTDPRSVVRESEYARTPEGVSLANRFEGALIKLQRGGAGITTDDIDALVWAAKVIGNEIGQSYNQLRDAYETQASNPDYDLDPNVVLGGFKPHAPFVADQGGGSASFRTEQEAEAANLPPGTIILINGRRARVR